MEKGYLGNERLKTTNTPVAFTEENIREIIKCKNDPVYFIKTYIRIVHVDKGLVPFQLYGFQEKIVETIHENRFIICKIPRQSGKTTTTIAYLLHYLLFNKTVNVAILANKADIAQDILSRLQLAYEHLPAWLQQGIVTWNKRNIKLENGSAIKAAATSSSSIRGGSYNIIFLDEFAHIDNALAEQFFRSVYPTISSGNTTKVVVVSTPKGMNHFHQMWTAAEKADELRKDGKTKDGNMISRFVPIAVDWWDVPGRDEDWREQELANLGSEENFEQEYGCEFIGSSDTLIAAKHLRRLASQWRKPLYDDAGLTVYEEPMVSIEKDKEDYETTKPHVYVIAADTGWGKQLDYSAFTVVDVTEAPYRCVAQFRSNIIQPLLYPNKLYEIGKKYHNAYILLEINDVGLQVAQALHFDLEYENILTVAPKGRGGQQLSAGFQKTTQLGLKMTSVTKKIGCANMKTLLESNKLLLWDHATLAELTTFVQNGSSFEAEEGGHDDLVMSIVVFSWLVTQKYFKELINIDIRLFLQKDQADEIETNMLPHFISDDGINYDIYSKIPGDPQQDAWRVVQGFGVGWSGF